MRVLAFASRHVRKAKYRRGAPAFASRTAPAGESRLKLLLVESHGVELTQRQADVLALLVQGKPNKIISRELGLAPGTVKIHVTAILRKLKVANRTQAALTASRFVAAAGESSYATGSAVTTPP